MDWYLDLKTGLYVTGPDREWQVEPCNDGVEQFGSLFHYGEFVGIVDDLLEAEEIIKLEIAP